MNQYREGKVKSTPERGVKRPETVCLQAGEVLCRKAGRLRTFCIMNRRLNERGKLKPEGGGEAKASPKWATSRVHYNPKPGDLLMARLKRG